MERRPQGGTARSQGQTDRHAIDDARQAYSKNHAQQDDRSHQHNQEPESEVQFLHRMQEKLKHSGKESGES